MTEEKDRSFQKPALATEQHIELLQDRGLKIENKTLAHHTLSYIGYYHLSAYALTFQNADNSPNHHDFMAGTRFEDILKIYDFDRNLRVLIIDAVERIEIGLRAVIIDTMSVPYGPHWYMDKEYFDPKFRHEEFLTKIQNDIGHGNDPKRMRDICIRHYYQTYDNPSMPPIWMVFESLSFSTVSIIFKHLNHSDKKRIAKEFGLPVAVLGSWLHSIAYTRNLCAHHQRLWNRVFTIKPLIPTDRSLQDIAEELNPNTKFYAQAIVLGTLLNRITPENNWVKRLQSLLENLSDAELKKMGFSGQWAQRDFWK